MDKQRNHFNQPRELDWFNGEEQNLFQFL